MVISIFSALSAFSTFPPFCTSSIPSVLSSFPTLTSLSYSFMFSISSAFPTYFFPRFPLFRLLTFLCLSNLQHGTTPSCFPCFPLPYLKFSHAFRFSALLHLISLLPSLILNLLSPLEYASVLHPFLVLHHQKIHLSVGHSILPSLLLFRHGAPSPKYDILCYSVILLFPFLF